MIATRGQKVETHAPDDALAAMLGRSGTLRAPAFRVGRTLYVGFPKGGFDQLD